MKKLLLLFVTCCIGVTSAWSQISFKIGPMAGMNSTELSTTIPYQQQIAGSGYVAGAFARVVIRHWYIQPEFMFDTKFATLSGVNTITNTPYNVNFNLSGYDVNILGGYELYRIKEVGNIRAFGGLGQSQNNNTSFNFKGIYLPQLNLASGTTNVIAGVGADILKFTADFRIERSLTEVYTSSNKVATNVFILSIGVKFL